jgi:hypothetical protein
MKYNVAVLDTFHYAGAGVQVCTCDAASQSTHAHSAPTISCDAPNAVQSEGDILFAQVCPLTQHAPVGAGGGVLSAETLGENIRFSLNCSPFVFLVNAKIANTNAVIEIKNIKIKMYCIIYIINKICVVFFLFFS